MVDRLCSTAGGLEDDREVFLELALSDEFVECAGSEPGFGVDLSLVARCGVEELVTHGALPAT